MSATRVWTAPAGARRVAVCVLGVMVALATACAAPPEGGAVAEDALVAAVRAANAAGEREAAAALVSRAREAYGQTPTVLVAQSWVGRGALAAGDLDTAETVGRRTYDEVQTVLQARALDDEPQLPLALGASIELLANVAVARDARSEALAYLESQHDAYKATSIAMRLQKNINLLSLEGTAAPALSASEFVGDVPPPPLSDLRGRVVLMFFWAHWCSDCKQQGPVLARLLDRYADQGLTLFAPTQRYGYVAGGRDAAADEEATYIAGLWRDAYAPLVGAPVTLDAANHSRYGVSTTPTLVLVDRQGVIRLYHPGQMTEEALAPLIEQWLAADPSGVSP